MHYADARLIPPSSESARRIVIIGGGAVGLFLASILSSRPGIEVVVVESGSRQLGVFSPRSWVSVGREHLGVRLGRSRSLGGTSNLWGGQLAGFRQVDIRRVESGGVGWPISYEELSSFYPEAYGRLGVPEELRADGPIWQGVVGATPELAPNLEVFLTRWMREPSMARLFSADIDGPRIHVLLGHAVVGFRGTGGNIARAVVRDRQGRQSELSGEAFVVAAGTIESSRLMLAAAADKAFDCPWRGNANVGRYFQDHITGQVGQLVPIDKKRLAAMFCTIRWKGRKYQPKFRFSQGYQRANGLLGVQGIVTFEGSVAEHVTYLKQFLKASLRSRRVEGVGDALAHAFASAQHLPPLMWTYIRHHRIGVPSGARIVLYAQAEQAALAGSQIRLDLDNVDEYGMPRAVLDWQIDGDIELRSIRDFAVQADAAMRESGLARVEISQRLLDLDPKFLDTLHDTWHQCGGCIMGSDADHGVVDSNLRVFGTGNLYVCGASTFPTNGEANVTFPALALAVRLSGHLVQCAPRKS